MSRVDNGFKLYQKGNVELINDVPEELQFSIKSKGNEYLVVINDDKMRCIECEDWSYRFGEAAALMSSFLCKHCYAALFKLAEVKGVGKQSKLYTVAKMGTTEISMIDHKGQEWITVDGKLVIKNQDEKDEPSN